MDYNITYREKNKGIQAIISYKDNGKWKQKSKQGFKTQKAAKPWIEKTVDDLKEKFGADINLELAGTTYEQLYGMAIKHLGLYREPNTIIRYDTANKHFSKIYKKNVTEINSLDIQECVDDMVKSKLQSNTVIGNLGKIKIIFDYAVDPHKIIKINPVKTVTVPTDKDKKNKKKEIKALNTSELEILLSKIKNPKYKLMSLIAATCGPRVGEILGLTWDAINEQKSEMRINRQWKISKIKPVIYDFGRVKSTNSDRIIPIPAKTMAAILKYKKDYPTHISNRLFPYTRTDTICNATRQYYRRLGFEISIHDLRHTYASTLVANGVDFKTVAELMGDTVEVIINTYSHFTSDMLDNAKKAVNNIF